MKQRANRRTVIVVLASALLFPAGLFAATITHHGMQADPNNSYECVDCHDGTIASNVKFCTTKCSVVTPHSAFNQYSAVTKSTDLQPQSVAASRGVRFVDGKVACISCHDIRKPGKNHLVMDNSKSQLCLACHIR